jgi:hypothetical protein
VVWIRPIWWIGLICTVPQILHVSHIAKLCMYLMRTLHHPSDMLSCSHKAYCCTGCLHIVAMNHTQFLASLAPVLLCRACAPPSLGLVLTLHLSEYWQ